MEIANGIIYSSDAHEHHVYSITPAEALVICAMHGKPALYSVEVLGEAKEVDKFGNTVQLTLTRIEKGKHPHKLNGKTVIVEGEEEITETVDSDKPRTESEEIARLRNKYTGHVIVNGQPLNAVDVAIGGLEKLPSTFKQIKKSFGDDFLVSKEESTEAPKAE